MRTTALTKDQYTEYIKNSQSSTAKKKKKTHQLRIKEVSSANSIGTTGYKHAKANKSKHRLFTLHIH